MTVSQRSVQGPEPTPTDEKSAQSKESSGQEGVIKGRTKRDNAIWQNVIRTVEHDIAKETEGNCLENNRAVLAFIQEHGYPDGKAWDEGDPEYRIWAMDGLARWRDIVCSRRGVFNRGVNKGDDNC
ncbi:hypothetical protein INS49_014788 [Diaporthe citri]|uniref:uncharacterized protein n=1 Tax=Diaporthe citri TaxID=83186 RepID=UPI001C8250D1|nr:uncharacterized protein INS49_014788 [Diaporthe citri]KAG6356913.1 hypothetical protein INS49_014788 [Diaporthe citri]